MKKYTIKLYHFNEKNSELESIETLKTKEITIERLKELILKETVDDFSVCWSVTPRPKKFIL